MTSSQSAQNYRLLPMIGLLYITQGIPLGLAMETLPTLLRKDGASLTSLAFLPLVGLPWICKFLWASQLDNRWSPRWGKRRSWILPMQSVVLLCLIATAAIGLSNRTQMIVVGLFFLSSLAAATQDTATDGLAVENLSGEMLVLANGIQVGGTMIGFFIGGSACLVLSGLFGRTIALLAVAMVVATGLLLAALWREPEPTSSGTATPRASLRRFAERGGGGVVVAIAIATAMSASATFALFRLFLVDRQWPVEQIGTLGMAGGVATIVFGCWGGAWLITRIGLKAVLFGGIILLVLSAAIWASVALRSTPVSIPLALIAVICGSIGSGAASVGAMTYAMWFAQGGRQAGTDMTAVQSSRDFGEISASSAAAAMAGNFGYAATFGTTVLLGTLTLMLVAIAVRGTGRPPTPDASSLSS